MDSRKTTSYDVKGHETVTIELSRAMSLSSEDEELSSHYLLKGGRPNYPHKYTAGQMEALTALCDTLVPAINLQRRSEANFSEDAVRSFYATSASAAGIPEHLAGFISERLVHAAVGLMWLSLWLLSTSFGTFILCGRLSLSREFPHFQRFSQVAHHRREEILRSWSRSSWYIFRLMFKGIKFLCLFCFYTKVDDRNENPSWKAIGYCGPDPEFPNNTMESRRGPLGNKVIDLGHAGDNIADILREAGCTVTEGPSHVQRLWAMNNRCKRKSLTIKCDVVVIGSGCGGGVAAGVIAQAGYKVVVLEKGKYFARENLSLLEGPSLDHMYEGGGLLATDDIGIVLLAGSTIGGGSSVNWSASLRTPQHVLQEWNDKLQLSQFISGFYTEAMDIVCQRMGVQEQICRENFTNMILRKGCEALGYPVSIVPRNTEPDHFCGWCSFGCKDGKKQGTQETWLLDAALSANAVILAGCRATGVVQAKTNGKNRKKRNKAVGVIAEIGTGSLADQYDLYVESHATVVACGALCTPSLLRKSGLRNPNIGRNLHLHPVQMAWGYFPETEWPQGNSYEGGVMTAMLSNFESSGYGTLIQTPSLHPGLFSVLMPWVSGMDMKERMTRFSRTAHIFALARDRGSGTVDLPRSLKYTLDSSDETSLGKGIEKVLRIIVAAGAEEIGTHHCSGERFKVKGSSPAQVENFIRRASSRSLRDLSTPLCSAHQMGSCRMGVDHRTSVVDPRGETWEVEGLFVADASVFPTAIGVNPMVTVQSIAYCTAKFVLDSLREKKQPSSI